MVVMTALAVKCIYYLILSRNSDLHLLFHETAKAVITRVAKDSHVWQR